MIPRIATNFRATLIAPRLAVTAAHLEARVGGVLVFGDQRVTITHVRDLRSLHNPSPDLMLLELSAAVVGVPVPAITAAAWNDRVTVINRRREACHATVYTVPGVHILAHDTTPRLVADDSGAPMLDVQGRIVGIVSSIHALSARGGITAMSLVAPIAVAQAISREIAATLPAPEQPATTRGRRPQPPPPMREAVRP